MGRCGTDVLATRDEDTLYLHAINRHFGQALAVQVDLSALDRRPGVKGILHLLEGRLKDAPEGSETPAPGQIRDETFGIAGDEFTVRLPCRSVTVVEVPLLLERQAQK